MKERVYAVIDCDGIEQLVWLTGRELEALKFIHKCGDLRVQFWNNDRYAHSKLRDKGLVSMRHMGFREYGAFLTHRGRYFMEALENKENTDE